MWLKKQYMKTRSALTSPGAKKFYGQVGRGAVKAGKYVNRMSDNLDNTFSIPGHLPDNTLSNYNVPQGYKLVKEQYIIKKNNRSMIATRLKLVKIASKKPKKKTTNIPKGYKLVKTKAKKRR